MVIKASASTEIRPLIDALRGPDDVMREVAVARLAVIGPRAVPGLIQAYRGAPDPTIRTAVLRALEPIGDRRALALADDGLRDGGDVAIAAMAVLRGLLDSPHGEAATAALDRLVATALDPAAAHRVRMAAFEALPDTAIQTRVARALGPRGDDFLRTAVAGGAAPAEKPDAIWRDAIEGRLPDDPAALEACASTKGASAPLTALHKVILAVRERERHCAAAAARVRWTALRGALHQSLASRGSRVALYDLLETLAETNAALPISFLATLQLIGDASCLEAIASAYDRAGRKDEWWRRQLASVFRAICARGRITKRHAALKRVSRRHPELMG